MMTITPRTRAFGGRLLLCWLAAGAPLLAQGPAVPAPEPAPEPAPATPAPPVPTPAPTPTTPVPVPVPGLGFPSRLLPPRPGGADAEPAARNADGGSGDKLKFKDTPTEIVLQDYAQKTGMTLLFAPDVPKANITLRSETELTRVEYLQAIETILMMNGIALQQAGERFLKVLPAKDLRKLGAKTLLTEPNQGVHEENGRMVSQMVVLQHILIEEARKAIEGFKRGEGQIQLFERTNSILITDTTDNVNRMMEILKYIDQPLVAREETNVRAIRFAKAADIKKRLEEIVADALKAQQQSKDAPEARTSGAPGIVRRTLPTPIPGVFRAPGVVQPAVENEILETMVADAERGVIRGKVQVIADERTNLLIIITRPENMAFFDKIINVLDVETSPDVVVEVFRLEYAQAKDLEGILNDLIGNQKKDDSSKSAGTSASSPGRPGEASRSEGLSEAAARAQQAVTGAKGEPGKSKIGELNKDNIKILADERTNALVIMGSQSDLVTLREIISDMDIMLSQVMIETVIVEVTLTDELATGIDWVQRSLLGYNGGGGERAPGVAFAGQGGGGSTVGARSAAGFTTPESFGGPIGGISYYATLFNLNVDLIVEASKKDNRTRVMQSPVILTQDNKEATIEATKQRYFLKGKRYAGGDSTNPVYEDDVEVKDVGTTVKVTPRINAKGFVVMKIEEAIENVTEYQTVNETEWPVVTARKLGADIAVQSGQTVILGGLVITEKVNNQNKIPLLGDIPLLGNLFRSNSLKDNRTEVLVFLTPYVLNNPEELVADAQRRKDSSSMGDLWQRGWSDSQLADDPDPKSRQARDAAHRDLLRRKAAASEDGSTSRPPAKIGQLVPMTVGTVTTNTLLPETPPAVVAPVETPANATPAAADDAAVAPAPPPPGTEEVSPPPALPAAPPARD